MGFAELAAIDVSFKSEQEQPSHVVVPLQLLMSFPYRITEIDPHITKLASQNETQKLRKIKFEKINLKRNEMKTKMYCTMQVLNVKRVICWVYLIFTGG